MANAPRKWTPDITQISAEDVDTLRQAAHAIADARQALNDLRARVNNPNINRLCADLDDMAEGSLGVFTETERMQ